MIAQLCRVKLLRSQNEFRSCNKKWAAIRGGVGSGKTTAIVYWALQRLHQFPGAAHFVVGSDYEQLRRGFFATFTGLLEEVLGWEPGRDFRYRDTPSPMLTLLPSGARLRSLSAEQVERIRSVEIQSLVCEEPQTWQQGERVYRVLLGRLRHSQRSAASTTLQPQGRMTFNPAPIGSWLYELIEKRWPVSGYPCWRVSVRDNVLLSGRDEFVAQLEAQLPEHLWPVEVDGHWASTGGQAYRCYDARTHHALPATLGALAIDPAKPLLWSLDFNVGKMCSVIGQMVVQRGIGNARLDNAWQQYLLVIADEIVLRNAGTPDVVDEFLRRFGDVARRVGVKLYGDASGGARSQLASAQSAVRSNWDAVLQGLRAAGVKVDVRVPRANPSVGDRVNAVNAQLRDGTGAGMAIDNRCEDLIADLLSVQYRPGSTDLDKSDLDRTHSSDALGYLVWVERQLRRDRSSVSFSLVR